jgi:hypothetical protein
MQAQAAEFSCYAGKFRCFLESFLARNELIASVWRTPDVIFAG